MLESDSFKRMLSIAGKFYYKVSVPIEYGEGKHVGKLVSLRLRLTHKKYTDVGTSRTVEFFN